MFRVSKRFGKPPPSEMLTGKLIMDSLRLQVNKMVAIENNLMRQRENRP